MPKTKKPTKKPITKKKTKVKTKVIGHYKTGLHSSPKAVKSFTYKSGWELDVAIILDNDPDVLCYSYEGIGIPYRSPNKKSIKIRRYFPDFFVSFKDGSRLIIEVKRDDKIDNIWTKTKAEACIEWSKKSGIKFQIWGSKQILEAQFRLFNKQVQMKKQELKIP